MKRIILGSILVLTVLSLLVVGCNTDNSTASLNPEPTSSAAPTGNGISVFRLPQALPGTVTILSESKLIRPGSSTVLTARLGYTTIDGKEFSADAKFQVPAGAVGDTVTITVALDTVNAAIQFEPEGLQFLQPALVDITLKNLDPFSTSAIVKFFYESNGGYIPYPFEQIKVTGNEGKIILKAGVIPHFSRYIFGRLLGPETHE